MTLETGIVVDEGEHDTADEVAASRAEGALKLCIAMYGISAELSVISRVSNSSGINPHGVCT